MLKRIWNFFFGRKTVQTVALELNAIEVTAPKTVKPLKDVYFPVTALAETPTPVAEVKKTRKPRKPKTAVAKEEVITDGIDAPAKKKRRYYKPRKKKIDDGSVKPTEKSL
jgi:hypothetical protein